MAAATLLGWYFPLTLKPLTLLLLVDTADERDLQCINHWLKRIKLEASSILLRINVLLLSYGFRELLVQRLTCP